ncbi:autotransporter assembly complex protein TamA [Reyranella soli]|uniref:Membrane protein n=1 Tax=Reyranella soli TaxID=1230389 RepID=A0A512N3M6_9HYPH|nr:autotransporter assembly complex family protein [Reyranella soli]GEP53599.1 membrane protein [Reyranella soli]
MALAALLAMAPGGSAEARTAKIALVVSGDEQMQADLKELVERFEKDQPLSGDSLGLLQGAQAAAARINTALRSRGYYDATIKATVDGRPIAEPGALDAIDARPDNEPISFAFDIATGPRYRVADVAIRPPNAQTSLPGIDRAKLGLSPGDPADAAAILEAQDKLIAELRKQGYALASIKRDVVVNHATREATVTFVAETGPLARMGPVRFSGSDKVDMVWLQRRVPFKEGDPYDPAKVEAMRGKLTSLGVFNAVRIKPAATLDANGELPFDVELTDRLSRSIGFGVSYETQLGFAVSGFWTHRNLFGQAESLRLTAELTHIGQGYAILDTGFAFRAAFRKPDWWLAGQDARLEAAGLREVLDAYTRNAVTAYAGFDRVFSPRWRAQLGFAGEASRITRNGITMDYQLVGLPLSILYNHANSDLNPTEGYRLDLDVTPWVYSRDFFTVIRLTGRYYYDFSEDGRSVLATRASLGSEPAISIGGIPPDKYFYAGGGGSVRGFVYQSAGPRDAFNNPLGGASVVETSVEFRQRIGKSWGAVAFVDAGSAYPYFFPDVSLFAPRVGAGVGARYYTDFGPVRVDVGFPLNRREGDPAFGVYVSLGQAF